MGCGIAKTRHLSRLRRKVVDRVETRYTAENCPPTEFVAKSPMVTPISAPPGLARSLATIALDISMP
jgi:hypothetical protein